MGRAGASEKSKRRPRTFVAVAIVVAVIGPLLAPVAAPAGPRPPRPSPDRNAGLGLGGSEIRPQKIRRPRPVPDAHASHAPIPQGSPSKAEVGSHRRALSGSRASLALGRDPLKIFRKLRNGFEYEPYYYGAVKSPTETLDARAGNDYDLAALLVKTLKKTGTPARFARRTVKVDGKTLARWVGVDRPADAATILATGGTPIDKVVQPDGPPEYFVKHVWVEACIPRPDRRCAWRPFDPSFKLHSVQHGHNLVEEAELPPLHEDLEAIQDFDIGGSVLSRADLDAIPALLAERRQQIVDHVAAEDPDMTVGDTVGGRTIITKPIRKVPRRPPLPGTGRIKRFNSPPEGVTQFMRVQLFGLDHEFALPDVAHKRITISFAPETQADEDAIAAAGGILGVEPNSVSLVSELRLDGKVVAVGGAAPVGAVGQMFVDQRRGDVFFGRTQNVVTYGGAFALVFNTQTAPLPKIKRAFADLSKAVEADADPLSDEFAGQLLYLIGLIYFKYNDLAIVDIAGTDGGVFGGQVWRAHVGLNLVADGSTVPAHMATGGYFIDVGTSGRVFRRDRNASFDPIADLMTIGVESSAFEHRVFAETVGFLNESTIMAFQDSLDEDVPLQGIGPENADAVFPTLDIPAGTKGFLQQSVADGFRVVTPSAQLGLREWSGIGWIVYNPETGYAAFLIDRLNGGIPTSTTRGLSPAGIQDVLKQAGKLLESFSKGAILGDFDKTQYDDPVLKAANLTGQIAGGLNPAADIRDMTAATIKIVESGGEEGWTDLGLSGAGLLPGIGDGVKACVKADCHHTIKTIFKSDEVAAFFKNEFGDTSADVATNLSKSADEVTLLTPSSCTACDFGAKADWNKGNVSGTNVEVNSGTQITEQLGFDPENLDSVAKATIGEEVATRYLTEQGFVKVTHGASPSTGLDDVWKVSDDEYMILEYKYKTGDANVSKDTMMTTLQGSGDEVLEGSDEWIQDRLPDTDFTSAEEEQKFNDALTALTVSFVTTMTKDVLIGGKTVSAGFGQVYGPGSNEVLIFEGQFSGPLG